MLCLSAPGPTDRTVLQAFTLYAATLPTLNRSALLLTSVPPREKVGSSKRTATAPDDQARKTAPQTKNARDTSGPTGHGVPLPPREGLPRKTFAQLPLFSHSQGPC